MYNEKIDNLLNLSLNSTQEELEKSDVLGVGFDNAERTWEVIVKYVGDLSELKRKFPQIQGQELLFQYGVLRILESQVDIVANDVQISYMEKPKNLFFAVEAEQSFSCGYKCHQERASLEEKEVFYEQISDEELTGQGTIIAVIDSGIDYSHPDFRNEDGTTRILFLWDQTLQRVFDSTQINKALQASNAQERIALVPSRDLSGHGTHVAGIAAGNGRASAGRYVGAAPQANLIVVKLGTQREEAFPRTTELMSAVDFCLRQSYSLKMPVVVNLSFGNNYGGHDGTSLLETYLNDVSDYWKSLLVVGTGNEGDSSTHTSGRLQPGMPDRIEFSVGEYETGFSIQIWKNYADEIEIGLVAPTGENLGELKSQLGTQRFLSKGTEVLVYYGMPSPYSVSQEVFFDFIPRGNYVDTGIWSLILKPVRIADGLYDLWMPGQALTGNSTAFLRPVETTTLTIPSTTPKVLSVGAYDSRFLTMATFSGRGFTRNGQYIKPDVVAPGVDIMSTSPNNSYSMRSGTSMATPYVSGKAALMMEDGIVKGKDPFLFGSKIIAHMHREAEALPGYTEYPNPITGWGRV